jgi:hypothetical protein
VHVTAVPVRAPHMTSLPPRDPARPRAESRGTCCGIRRGPPRKQTPSAHPASGPVPDEPHAPSELARHAVVPESPLAGKAGGEAGGAPMNFLSTPTWNTS